MLTRRHLMATGLAGSVAAAACSGPAARRGGDVVAAGQPAALLVWAAARERLAGWPWKPEGDALAALPPLAADLPELGSLTSGGGEPADIDDIAALRPRMVIDYGDADPEHRALADRLRGRLGVDWHFLDGSLARIPEALQAAGRLLEAEPEVENLAAAAASVLERWCRAPPGPSFYYARGADGLETGFHGALATEVLEGAGWANVAVGGESVGRVSLEQVTAWDPEAIVTIDPAFARIAAQDPVWRTRRNGYRRSLLLLPDTPFGWVDRPPSVNRLLGCAWLADPKAGWIRLSMLAHRLYGRAPREVARPRWIA